MSDASDAVDPAAPAPALRVVKGDPTAEELAALVVVLGSWAGATEPSPTPQRVWNTPARLHRVVHRHGAGGWRSSGLPG